MQRYLRLTLASLALSVILVFILGIVYPTITWALSLAVPKLHSELVSCYGVTPQFFRQFETENTSSGCDPFIPLNYALKQVPEVSRKTSLPKDVIIHVLLENAEKYRAANLYIFGPGYDIINVNDVNAALAKIVKEKGGEG